MVVLPALGRPVSQTVAPVVTWFSWFVEGAVMGSAVQSALGLGAARQQTARASSPSSTRRVQGAHPTEA
ncbi:hypothetical protein SALBM217S_00954 [Streptomyces griseoloalbus]